MLWIGGRAIRTTGEGFLVDAEDWNADVADVLAAAAAIELTDAHWEIIRFIRDYHQRYRHLPNARMFVKAVRSALGEQKGNSLYLYRLFPEGPLKQACLIGGLPKPPSCM